MKKVRVIARLDVKPPYVIKGVHFEGLRKMGLPADLALKYYKQGADEVFYIDAVASLYRREILYPYIEQTAKQIFIPFCVGGGIQTVDDVAKLLDCGADKIALNTFAIANPQLISQAARMFGSQCVTVSIEAKKRPNDWWECFTDYGRIPSGKDVVEWAKQAQDLGAGELLVTSVDHEGRWRGYDLELIEAVVKNARVPVVACGGAGSIEHIVNVVKAGADAVALASILHYDKTTISAVKKALAGCGAEVVL